MFEFGSILWTQCENTGTYNVALSFYWISQRARLELNTNTNKTIHLHIKLNYDVFFYKPCWWCVLTAFQKITETQLDLYSLPTKQGNSVNHTFKIPKLENLPLAQRFAATNTARDRKHLNIYFTHSTIWWLSAATTLSYLPPSADRPHFEPSGLNPGLGPEQFLELQQRLKKVPKAAQGAHMHPDNVPLVTALDANTTLLHSQHS